MSESITVEASSKEVKIKAMASPNPALEVSVSFGRFENDSSLSWEKWSTFSPNKYLEEVEKCATPGSVAQKKAYFEEHYKKIAARKAELLAQESPAFNSDCGDLVHESNAQCSDGRYKQETNLVSEEPEISTLCQIPWVEELKEKIYSIVQSEEKQEIMDSIVQSEEKQEIMDSIVQSEEKQEIKDSIVQSEEKQEIMDSIVQSEEKQEIMDSIVQSEEKQEIMDSIVQSPELNKPEETASEEDILVQKDVETLSKGSQDVGLSHRSENVIETTPKIKDKNLKLGQSTKSHKITAVNKEKNDSRIKKKTAYPVTKTPQVSTSRASKPSLTPATSSAPRTRLKTGTTLSYSSPKTKNPSVEQSKKVAPRSMHMSLSLDPSSSIPASLTTPRKSSFMEKMGDKDIVKRAFRTFQSNYNHLKPSSQEQSPAAKPAPVKGGESRVSTLKTPQKENGGSSRVSSMEKKNAKVAPSYSGLKSDERIERRKESSKKLEGKSNDREAERKNLQTKSKDNKDAKMKNLRQSFNFKASPLPSFYHGQRTTKSPLDKIGSKSDIHR